LTPGRNGATESHTCLQVADAICRIVLQNFTAKNQTYKYYLLQTEHSAWSESRAGISY